ncbi:hypothetical protein [Coleofasciculus sp. FACHB-129]|nr:hypothetical protein [Coleofasciculus sp. FACHB-129]
MHIFEFCQYGNYFTMNKVRSLPVHQSRAMCDRWQNSRASRG